MPAKNPRRLLVVFTKAGADKMPRLKNDAAAVHMVNSYVQVHRDSLRYFIVDQAFLTFAQAVVNINRNALP